MDNILVLHVIWRHLWMSFSKSKEARIKFLPNCPVWQRTPSIYLVAASLKLSYVLPIYRSTGGLFLARCWFLWLGRCSHTVSVHSSEKSKQQPQLSKGRLGSDKPGLESFQGRTLVFVNDGSTPMDLTQNGSATWPVFQQNSSTGCGMHICDLLPAACLPPAERDTGATGVQPRGLPASTFSKQKGCSTKIKIKILDSELQL